MLRCNQIMRELGAVVVAGSLCAHEGRTRQQRFIPNQPLDYTVVYNIG